MSVGDWNRREDLENKKKVRIWRSTITDNELFVEDLTPTGQGYAVFLYDGNACRWTKITSFADKTKAVNHASEWIEGNH